MRFYRRNCECLSECTVYTVNHSPSISQCLSASFFTWILFSFCHSTMTQKQADFCLSFGRLTRSFSYSICTVPKYCYKHSAFYRAKTITKINDTNLTAICLASVSVVRDCFRFLSIIIFLQLLSFLFSFYDSLRNTPSSLLSDLFLFLLHPQC